MISTFMQVDHNDKENKALNAFNQLWESKFAKDSLLVFSTGRSHALYSELRVKTGTHPVLNYIEIDSNSPSDVVPHNCAHQSSTTSGPLNVKKGRLNKSIGINWWMLLQKEVPLGNPDVLVCSVGTEIFFEAAGTSPEANKDWAAELDQGWDRAKAIETAGKFSELSPQASSSLPKTQQSYLL